MGFPTTGGAICNWLQATALLCRRFWFRRACGEEYYEFEFAELGVEVGGDFGDAFEGLVSTLQNKRNNYLGVHESTMHPN